MKHPALCISEEDIPGMCCIATIPTLVTKLDQKTSCICQDSNYILYKLSGGSRNFERGGQLGGGVRGAFSPGENFEIHDVFHAFFTLYLSYQKSYMNVVH